MSKQTDLINIPDAITVSGSNVGIGTSPSLGSNGSGLHIKGASGDYGVLKVDSSTTSEEGWVQFSNNGVDKFRIASDSSTNLKFIHSGVAERMRIDSSGRLLLGTSTSFADGNSENLQIAGSGNTGMIIKSGSANYGSIYFGDATSGGARNAGIVRYFHNDNSMQFWTNETERMRIDSSGAVTMPSQPAFLAQGNGQTNFPISTATTIDFETEVFDQGADFSSNTFTAPVTGRYLFACMVYARNLDIDTNYYQLQLITSNRTISAGLGTSGYDADMLYFPFSITLLLDMDVNDTAVLKIDVGSGGANQLIVESQTYFSGYLVA